MRIAAWLLIIGIAFVTLSPLNLRPKTGHPNRERYFAYLVCAACFSLAYPTRRKTVLVVLLATAGGLELGKLLTADRYGHAKTITFVVKASGAIAGALLSLISDGSKKVS